MKFKSKLAQAAYDELMVIVDDHHFRNTKEKYEAAARAIEVAARIEIEEKRLAQAPLAVPDHWKNPCCEHHWLTGRPHDGMKTCAICGEEAPQ